MKPDRPISVSAHFARSLIRVMRLWKIKLTRFGVLKHAQNFAIGSEAMILSPNVFSVGENVRIGQRFHCETDVYMGDDILISSHVSFVGNDHKFDNPNVTVFFDERNSTAVIKLEGDNLIGNGVIVVGPVIIGRGAIIGAGAVVTHDLPPYTVCVGVPAKPIRNRFIQAGT